LRAVHCDARNCHSPGLHLLLTGYENVRAGVEMERANFHHPAMGSILAKQLGATNAAGSPRFVAIPGQRQLGKAVKYTGPLFLGPGCEAFETGDPPESAQAPLRVPPGLILARDLSTVRVNDRLALRARLERWRADLDRQPSIGGMDTH